MLTRIRSSVLIRPWYRLLLGRGAFGGRRRWFRSWSSSRSGGRRLLGSGDSGSRLRLGLWLRLRHGDLVGDLRAPAHHLPGLGALHEYNTGRFIADRFFPIEVAEAGGPSIGLGLCWCLPGQYGHPGLPGCVAKDDSLVQRNGGTLARSDGQNLVGFSVGWLVIGCLSNDICELGLLQGRLCVVDLLANKTTGNLAGLRAVVDRDRDRAVDRHLHTTNGILGSYGFGRVPISTDVLDLSL